MSSGDRVAYGHVFNSFSGELVTDIGLDPGDYVISWIEGSSTYQRALSVGGGSTPIPEPTRGLLGLAGLAALVCARRRRG